MTAPRGNRLAELKQKLERVGASPLRRFGQNFLLDRNQVLAILRDADLSPLDTVLEVGPGSGFLSEGLAQTGAALLCVEIDRRIAMLAREAIAPYPNAQLLEGDILDGKHALNPEAIERIKALWQSREGRLLKCISNLPYSVATPFIINMLSTDLPWSRGVFMVQKEVAQRATAKAGSQDFGSLSVALGLAATAVSFARSVPPDVFWPRPQVQSAVLIIDYKSPAERLAIPWRALRQVANAIFCNRRKNLRNGLRLLFGKGEKDGPDAICAAMGLDGEAKAVNLTPETMLRIAHHIQDTGIARDMPETETPEPAEE